MRIYSCTQNYTQHYNCRHGFLIFGHGYLVTGSFAWMEGWWIWSHLVTSLVDLVSLGLVSLGLVWFGLVWVLSLDGMQMDE